MAQTSNSQVREVRFSVDGLHHRPDHRVYRTDLAQQRVDSGEAVEQWGTTFSDYIDPRRKSDIEDSETRTRVITCPCGSAF